jgi:hypothetical protein
MWRGGLGVRRLFEPGRTLRGCGRSLVVASKTSPTIRGSVNDSRAHARIERRNVGPRSPGIDSDDNGFGGLEHRAV